MKVAITGATGFLGRYLVSRLSRQGHRLRCWHRGNKSSPAEGSGSAAVEWVCGSLCDEVAATELLDGCDAIVHAALWRPGKAFRGGEGNIVEFARKNILGTLQLIETSIACGLSRFVFVSTCAVHERILEDRRLDEAHPLWPLSHYGAHKAALEKFVHSYGFGQGFPICSLRPTGIYGIADPVEQSKWYHIVSQVRQGRPVNVSGGGKEVHVSDVAQAIELLLTTGADISGEAYACYDRYVSQFEVATIAKEIAGSQSQIVGEATRPKHEIETNKIRDLGMEFGGTDLLRQTVTEMLKS